MPEEYVLTTSADSTDNKDKVSALSVAYVEMAPLWEMCDDLMGGTKTMRAAGEKWLPKEQHEKAAMYNSRLGRSFLYCMYKDTVERLTGKPFSKPVVVKGKASEQIQKVLDDCDKGKRDITQYGKELFGECLNRGHTHILVDYPTIEPQATLADERAVGARPALIHVKPGSLIGWRTEVRADGEEVLAQIRIHECRIEPFGNFLDQVVDYIRVFTKDTWELWRKFQGQDPQTGKPYEYQKIKEGPHTFGRIPLVTVYFNRTGFMTASPPLEDLAWMNVAHWQSMSDQRNILRFIRMGILFAKGFTEEQIENGIIVGPNHLVGTTSTDSDLKYVEHGGNAVEAGEKDIEQIEKRSEVLGLQPQIERTARSTATGKVLDESKTQTEIQSWVRALENGLLDAFKMAAEWIGETLPDDFAFDIFDKFGLNALGTDAEATFLLNACMSGKLSDKTFLNEIKRREMLSDDVDVDTELQDIADQGPPLGTLTNAEVDPVTGLPIKKNPQKNIGNV